MQIYIDQSRKIEYTSQDTVVAYSNGTQKSILISAEEKRKVQRIFRDASKPEIFMFKTFAILIYLLIKENLPSIDAIRIDREYSGKEWLIKQYLLELLRRHGFMFEKGSIEFYYVGKKHKSHLQALSVFQQKLRPDIIVNHEEILPYIL